MMHEVKTIVVPLDGEPHSELPLRLATDLALRLEADLLLLSSVLTLVERQFRLDQLRALAEELAQSGVAVRVEVALTHDIPGPITEAAASNGLIVMATSAKLGLHEGHMGSIAESVVRGTPEPVLLVGPHATPELGVARVVVPVDGSDAAEAALGPAADWAALLDVPLWVVTVVTPEQADAAAKAGVTAEHGYVKRLSQRVGSDVTGEFEVLHGSDPADRIVDFLGDDALCVMTTTGKSGIRRLVMGSVATGVVRRSPRPVLVVTAPG